MTHDREAGFQLGGMAERETGAALVGDLQKGDTAARIVADDAGRHLDAVDLHARAGVVADDGRGGEHGALVVDEKAGAGKRDAGVARLDLDHRRFRFLEEGVHFLAERLEDVVGRRGPGRRFPPGTR